LITIDLNQTTVRDLNDKLHRLGPDAGAQAWRVLNPAGKHAIAAGLDAPVEIEVMGHVGYYCGGMNKAAHITVKGRGGKALGENIMSGSIRVTGGTSDAAGASGHGGLIVIEGDAGVRCGISMKGVDIVVGGSVGHMSAFMAQCGHLVVCGDADHSLGDSIYEATVYVRGRVGHLGADCVEKDMTPKHLESLGGMLRAAGFDHDAGSFRRSGSARKLYNFNIDHADAY
jgi:glutamate synthase domain-containing protein 3